MSFVNNVNNRAKGVVAFTAGLFLAFLVVAIDASAVSSKFRMQFIFHRQANQLLQQENLIRENKAIVPDEIRALVADALAHDKTFEERMYLLDHAQAMASSYNHLFKDPTFLNEVRVIQDMELSKQEENTARSGKLAAFEGLRGSMVMKEHYSKMEEEGLNPVVFPHWQHQALFKCKACHDDTFKMKRGSNDISHERFANGKQCASCHDSKTSFGIDDNCTKCHVPIDAKLPAYGTVDHVKLKAAAARLGGAWNADALPEAKDGSLPLDELGNIDWLKLMRAGVSKPVSSAGGVKQEYVKDDNVLFNTPGMSVDAVLFSHNVHSSQIDCMTCHTRIFKDSLGANEVRMNDLGSGRYCGACHGKVSFTLFNCERCHNTPPGKPLPPNTQKRK